MHVLIDYDNVERLHRRLGVRVLLELILLRVEGVLSVPTPADVRVRLYGGWYEWNSISRNAQLLSAEVQGALPFRFAWKSTTGASSAMVVGELAYGLDLDRRAHFCRTYRPNRPVKGLSCPSAASLGCVHATCSLDWLHGTLRGDACVVPECGRPLRDILKKGEQKLTDTMLTVDILTAAHPPGEPVVLVSSDDDMWPGIHAHVARGGAVIQVHTKVGASARNPYKGLLAGSYSAVELHSLS